MERYICYTGRKTGVFRLLKLYKLYNSEFGASYPFPFASALKLIGRCIPGIVMLYDRYSRNVAAYAVLVSLTEEAYGMYRKGEIGFMDFTPDMIRHFRKDGGPHYLYFAVLQKNPENDDREILRRMISLITENMAGLAEKGIVPCRVVANAASEYGRRMCRMSGMQYIGNAKEGGRIYEGILCPMKMRVPGKAFGRLRDVCNAYAKD